MATIKINEVLKKPIDKECPDYIYQAILGHEVPGSKFDFRGKEVWKVPMGAVIEVLEESFPQVNKSSSLEYLFFDINDVVEVNKTAKA